MHLASLLQLDRTCLGFDLETTGKDPKTARIVELAFEIMTPGEAPRDYSTLVNPGMPIPPGSTAVHGITDAMVKDAPTFGQLAQNLLRGLTVADFVGYYVRYDLEVIQAELRRCGIAWDYETARIVDPFRIWQIIEPRSLTDATERWVSPEDRAAVDLTTPDGHAHRAMYDTKMAVRALVGQLQARPDLPRDIQGLHLLCAPDWVEATGKIRWNEDGEAVLGFGKHKDKPLREVPEWYFTKFILVKDFSDTVKAICRRAAAGIYPVKEHHEDVSG